jgi:tetratricopeptide (TPR) repeat protein
MPSGPADRFASWWKWTLLGALLFLALDTTERVLRLRALTGIAVSDLVAPQLATDSVSGYARGQRTLPLGYPDSYHWIRQTQEMLAAGDWRVRSVSYDNAPQGREVHWSSGLRWWLAGLGLLDHRLSGLPLGAAVEREAPLAMPLSLALFLLLGTPWLARRVGALAATVVPPLFVTCLPLYEHFGAEAPDHHGWVIACGMATVLALVAGMANLVPGEPPSRARRYFILSGVMGGVGLWISAATQVPVLIAVGIGAVLAAWGSSLDGASCGSPGLWRAWGLAGAATSLGFYLLEYAPAHFGWRLEVNHPLYALAWAGAADLLARWMEWRNTVEASFPLRAGKWRFLPGGLALAALPAAVLLTGAQTFWVGDRLLWALHVDYIKEFKGLPALAAQLSPGKLLGVVSLLPLALWLLVAWLDWRQLVPRWRAALWIALPPAALMLGLAVWQTRWYGPACGLALAAIATGLGAWERGSGVQRWSRWRTGTLAVVGLALLAAYPVSVMGYWWRTWQGRMEFSPHHRHELVVRDVAQWLRERVGAERAVVLSDPTSSSALAYFGGFDTVGTLYWENLPGLRRAMEIYGAADAEQAHALIRESGVTHLVIFPWHPFAEESAHLAQGRRASEPAPAPAFLRTLVATGDCPVWLRPLSYETPRDPESRVLDLVRVFAVVPSQAPAEAALRAAQFNLAAGDASGAERQLRRSLAIDSSLLPARIFAARMAQGRGEEEEFRWAAQGIRETLGGATPSLELQDRIDLLMVLVMAGDGAVAVEQLQLCLVEANERALRMVRPDALFEFGECVRSLAPEQILTAGVVARIDAILPPLTRERFLFGHAVKLQRENRPRDAANLYRRQLALNPRSVAALGNLAWILASTGDATLRDPAQALGLAREAVALSEGREPFSLNALAAACAATGDFPAAREHARAALRRAEEMGKVGLLPHLRACIALYDAGRPYVETGSPPPP